MISIDRCWHGNDQELCFTQPCLIRCKINGGLANSFISDLMCRINTALVLLNPILVVVQANHPDMLCKFHGNGHTYIAESDKCKFFLSFYQPVIKAIKTWGRIHRSKFSFQVYIDLRRFYISCVLQFHTHIKPIPTHT